MPESATEQGKQFAREMRRVREMQGVSVADVHDVTKIPIGLIEAFEESGLFGHEMFNRVYLRSFVRSYARTIHISADVAAEALEEAAKRLGISVEELLRASVAETLQKLDADFEKVAQRVIQKNAELYRRLA